MTTSPKTAPARRQPSRRRSTLLGGTQHSTGRARLVSGKRAGAAVASFLSGDPDALADYNGWVRDWAEARYAPSFENRVLAAWVGLAPAERRLLALLAELEPLGEAGSE